MMLVGYARVSTADQSLELQKEALVKIGCERIFEDVKSGKNIDRSGFKQAMEYIRSGDTLCVWKLDRLARSMKDILIITDDLKQRGIHIISTSDRIDTSTVAGESFFLIMGAISQIERNLMLERTRAGLESARKAGRLGGRKTIMTAPKIEAARKLIAAGTLAKDVCKAIGISMATLYRHLPAAMGQNGEGV